MRELVRGKDSPPTPFYFRIRYTIPEVYVLDVAYNYERSEEFQQRKHIYEGIVGDPEIKKPHQNDAV